MSASGDEVKGLARSLADHADRVYREIGGRLLRVLVEDLGVPADDAEAVLTDAFIAYITTNVDVHDPQGWLTAAALTAGKAYLDSRALGAAIVSGANDPRTIREALTFLPASAREALRLRLIERHSYAEIANALDVHVYYAQKLVAKAVASVRDHVRARKSRDVNSDAL